MDSVIRQILERLIDIQYAVDERKHESSVS